MTGNISLAGKTQSQAQASVDRDNAMKAAEGKVEIKNPFEQTGQTKKEQAKIASDVQELRDKVKTYNQEFTPGLYVDLDKYMEDKGLYSSIDTGPKIDVGFQ